jgi:hypothetical protein
MNKAFFVALAVILGLPAMPGLALSQAAMSPVIGTVRDTRGRPVSGVKIVGKHRSVKILTEAIADAGGRYALTNLPAGQYLLTLDPLNTPFQGQTVVSSVGPQGLTVDWIVSSTAPAIASALPGAANEGAFGLSPEKLGFLGFLGAAGLEVGIAASAGAFDSPKSRSSQTVISGSQ